MLPPPPPPPKGSKLNPFKVDTFSEGMLSAGKLIECHRSVVFLANKGRKYTKCNNAPYCRVSVMNRNAFYTSLQIQSTLVILRSRGLFEQFEIVVSCHQICITEEKINQTTTFQKKICKLSPEARYVENIVEKNEEQFLLFSTIFYYLLLDFYVKTGTRFLLRGKRLFEISET